MAALINASTTAKTTPIVATAYGMDIPPRWRFANGKIAEAQPKPTIAANTHKTSDSTRMTQKIRVSEKPSAFSTANSVDVSRNDCIIMAPSENSSAKNTAPTTDLTTKLMSPRDWNCECAISRSGSGRG